MASSFRQLLQRIRRTVADFAGDRQSQRDADAKLAEIRLEDPDASVNADSSGEGPPRHASGDAAEEETDIDSNLRFELGISDSED